VLLRSLYVLVCAEQGQIHVFRPRSTPTSLPEILFVDYLITAATMFKVPVVAEPGAAHGAIFMTSSVAQTYEHV
jgi:hypothetical protein